MLEDSVSQRMTAPHTRKNSKPYRSKQKKQLRVAIILFSIGQKEWKRNCYRENNQEKTHNPLRWNKKKTTSSSLSHGDRHVWLENKSYGLLRGTRGHSSGSKQAWGTGLLSGGGPRRGHTGHIVECSSSRVTYCYTVLSPVKIHIYTCTEGMLETRLWHLTFTKCMKVRKDWKWWQENKRQHNACGGVLKLGCVLLVSGTDMQVSTVSEELHLKTTDCDWPVNVWFVSTSKFYSKLKRANSVKIHLTRKLHSSS